MSTNAFGERSGPSSLEEALVRRLERRLRRVERLESPRLFAEPESDSESSLQALSERITRLRIHAELLYGRSSS